MTTKLTVNLPDDIAEQLKAMAKKRNISVTEVLRRAISTERWVESIADDKDKKLLVENQKDGQYREVIFR